MSDNWIVQNLERALETWNDKLAEIWQLITQSPETFKGGAIWSMVQNIYGAQHEIEKDSLGRPRTLYNLLCHDSVCRR